MTAFAARIAAWFPARPRVLLAAAYVASYVALDWASTIFPIADFGLAPWNPATGVSLAFILRAGSNAWTWLFVAGAASELLLRGAFVSAPIALAIGMLLAAGYAGAGAMMRRMGFDPDFRTLRDAIAFLPITTVVTLAVAAGYVALYEYHGLVAPTDIASGIFQYWIGDLIGILVVTPAMLVFTRPDRPRLAVGRGELVLHALALIAALWVVFWSSLGNELRHFYVLFVPLIWIAMRQGLPGTIIAILGLQVAMLVALQLAGHDTETLTEFQSLMAVLAAMGVVLAVSVSEREDGQARLAAQEHALRTVLATAPDAILTIDAEGWVVGANPAAEQMFGLTAARLAGRRLSALLDAAPGASAAVQPRVMTATGGGGRRFPVEVTTSQATGEAPLTVAVVRDISARRSIERALRAKEIELDRTLRLAAASETASALAHELNQPLAAVANYVRAAHLLLNQGTDMPATMAAMDKAVAEVARAGDVMRRLREFFQSGTMRQESVDVPALIESAVAGVQNLLQRHEIAIRVNCTPGLPPVMADPVQAALVLHNLLVNAVDALRSTGGARAGHIEVRARPQGSQQVMIGVIDNGPGVPESVVPHLFRPFASSKPEGMGLGLAISRSMIEAHGGELRYESLPEGTSFTITLPAARNRTT